MALYESFWLQTVYVDATQFLITLNRLTGQTLSQITENQNKQKSLKFLWKKRLKKDKLKISQNE